MSGAEPTLHAARRAGGALLARNTVLNLAGQALPMLVAVVALPVIVRGLGVDRYGVLSIAYTALGFFGVFDLGLGRATVKLVAERLGPNQVETLPAIVWTSVFSLLGLGTLFGLVGAALVPVVMPWLRMPPALEGPTRASLWLLCAGLPFALAGDALRGVLQAVHRFDLVNYVRAPASALLYALAAAAVWLGVGVFGIVLLLVLLRLAAALANLLLVLRCLPLLRRRIRPAPWALRPLFGFGGWVMLTNVTGALFTYVERLLIAAVLSVGSLTYYAIPFDISSRAGLLPASLGSALFPYFSQHGGDPAGRVRAATLRGVRFVLFCMAPLTAVLVCCGREILKLWLGTAFAAASTRVLQVLAIAFFVNAFAFIPYASVQALGRPEWKAYLDLVTLPAYVGVVWALLHGAGVVGAAWAKLIFSGLDCMVLFVLAAKLKAFAWRDYCTLSFLRAAGLGGLLFLAMGAIAALRPAGSAEVALAALALVVYVIAFWRYGADGPEREASRHWLGRLVAMGSR